MSPDESLDGRRVQVAVIGAGQAGLSAAYYLAARGLEPGRGFVVLDANDGPGGAWRHRWDSLTLGDVHGIHPLPGSTFDTPDPTEPANRVVPRYYGAYEKEHGLPVLRPVTVAGLSRVSDAAGRPREAGDASAGQTSAAAAGGFVVTTDRGRVAASTIVNATGTWDSPYLPSYPGLASFTGRTLHTHDYRDADAFTGRRVLVVGGGTSAVQFLQELDAHGAQTIWAARRTPTWTARPFDPGWGLAVEKAVNERTRRGLPPLSVSAVTGLPLTVRYTPDIRRGLLVWRGTIARFTPHGVVLEGPGPDGRSVPDQGEATPYVDAAAVRPLPGSVHDDAGPAAWHTPVDDVLWATGFRAHIGHLNPLGVRERGGGILMADDGVTAVHVPGLFLAGYGASASTIGATRAGRRAAVAALRFVGAAGR